ncbi:MAG: tryptophan synthase subunit alpha [Bacillales bacterium]|nr:tryptophan synthase subunit alpha [Bacillales bacterium]
MTAQTIAEAFHQLKQNNEKAFVAYIMAGDGGLSSLKDKVLFLEKAGASMIEIGIPFSDPVADGPVIQEAGKRALEEGVSLAKVLAEIAVFRSSVTIPLIVMTYINPVYAYGIERFVNDCAKAGINGVILPDVPFEEQGIISWELKDKNIDLIQLVTLTSPEERKKKLAEASNGFLYAVTVTGITGQRNKLPEELSGYLEHLKRISPVPVLAGFGISNHRQVKEVGSYCDGVIVGSKIVDLFHQGKEEEIIELIGKKTESIL